MSAETATRTIARFTVAVPRTLPTANSRLSWRARGRLTYDARHMVYVLAQSARTRLGIRPNQTEPRTVHITLIRGKGQKLYDADSAYAAVKPCLDGLRDAGWLVDDSPRWLTEYVVTQRKDQGDPRCEVEIGVPS